MVGPEIGGDERARGAASTGRAPEAEKRRGASDGALRAQPVPPPDDPTAGIVAFRHVPGGTRAAYNRIYRGAGIRHPDRFWTWILDLVAAAPGERLLDVACGEGQLVARASALGLEAHGVDLSDVALGAGRRAAPAASFAVADGERLPYPDASFDVVTNMGSLEHYEDPVSGAAEMARVAAPGGRVCLHVPNLFGLRWNVAHGWRHGDVPDDGQPIQRYGSRAQWTRVLAAGGLEVERVLGLEEAAFDPLDARALAGIAAHPTRLLARLAGRLPVDMASILVFVCRPAHRA